MGKKRRQCFKLTKHDQTTPTTPTTPPLPSRYFGFQPNKEVRYSAEADNKTTFLFGEITTLSIGTQMIQVKLMRNAISTLPFETEEYTTHQIKIMKLVNPSNNNQFVLIEYIDTFDDYMIGADMINNPLWSEADEVIWRRDFSHLTDTAPPHPNITRVETDDVNGVNGDTTEDTSPTQ